MNKDSKIYVAGHRGMVGSAITKQLNNDGFTNIILKTHRELDLTRQTQVEEFFDYEKPEYVFLAAARVGGILANSTHKAEFYYENSMIAQNVIHSSWKSGVKKLMNLGSSCIYPKMAPQPMKEKYLLTGELESTNDAYAISKISAIKMCRYYNEQYGTNFLSVMPTNLYGERDNYDLETSHVLPALIRKFDNAKRNGGPVELWGDGTPRREFLFADDLAAAVVFLMKKYSYSDISEFVNIGTGLDCTIQELAGIVSEIIGYPGEVFWDTSKPNGTPRKLLDISRLSALGWNAKISLKEGIKQSYKWYCENS